MTKQNKKTIKEILRNRILDITDEYKGKKRKEGVSVFLGYPSEIIKELEKQND